MQNWKLEEIRTDRRMIDRAQGNGSYLYSDEIKITLADLSRAAGIYIETVLDTSLIADLVNLSTNRIMQSLIAHVSKISKEIVDKVPDS